MLLVRFLFGCGEAGAFPNLARVVGSWFPFRERGLALGSIWMSARIGGAISPLIIGALSGMVGWQKAFWVLGLVGVVWCVVFAYFFRNRPEDSPFINKAELDVIRAGPHSWEAHTAGAGHSGVPWRKMLLSANLWFVCLAGFGVSFGWYFYPTWQPKFLEDVHKMPYETTELLTGLPFLCGAFGCIIGGPLSDWAIRRTGSRRWGRSLIGLFGFTGAGACLLSAAHVPEAWQCVVLLSLATFINDLAVPVIWAVATDIGGRFAGTVAGFINMIGALGGMITPSLIPVLKRDLPAGWSLVERWQTIILVLASAFFVAGVSWLWIDASKPLFPDDRPKNVIA
jgi:MFS family permease